MTVSARLQLAVAAILAGCGGELDSTACLSVPESESCPDEATASDQLVGTELCSTPVLKVTATGALVSDDLVIYTGYGGFVTPDDTGATVTGDVQRQCCYEAATREKPGQSCVIGRPLMDDGRMVTAEPTGEDWTTDDRPSVRKLTEEDRAALADAWQEQGLLEHASVAAFARLVLDLLELGATAELVDRASLALQDEIRHAARCFALASAYAGREIGPGPLPMPARRGRRTLTRLAVESWREGCVGETLSVALAAAQLRGATDPVVRDVITGILRDESEHAQLAWDIVAWAQAQGGVRVKRAVRREAQRTVATPPAARATSPVLMAHGIPSEAVVREALARVAVGVIAPSTEELC